MSLQGLSNMLMRLDRNKMDQMTSLSRRTRPIGGERNLNDVLDSFTRDHLESSRQESNDSILLPVMPKPEDPLVTQEYEKKRKPKKTLNKYKFISKK